MQRVLSPWALPLLVLSFACGGGTLEDVSPDEVFLEAESQFNQAQFLLEEGDIMRSWAAMRSALGLVDSYLEGDGRTASASWHRREAQVMGLTLVEWKQEWRKRYGLKVQMSWTGLVEALGNESVDLPSLQAFAAEYLGGDYVAALNDEYDRLRPVLEARREGQYWFTCEDVANLCGLVLEAVVARMPDNAVTTEFTGDRADYKGVIEVQLDVLGQGTYEQPVSAAGKANGLLVESASVSLNVSTREGDSEWDGPFELTIQRDLPAKIERYAFPRVAATHRDRLREDLASQLDSWPSR